MRKAGNLHRMRHENDIFFKGRGWKKSRDINYLCGKTAVRFIHEGP